MYYIIFDLEWNNAYDYKTGKGMNEIIEIGAVKLNEKLNMVDTFKQLIKPTLSKKLTGRFKNLTHITSEEIRKNGVPFDQAFQDFARWSGRGNNIFLSWSNSDLFVLIDNFKKFKGTAEIPFIKKYADVQKYCMSFIEDTNNGNQISLLHSAEKFGIDADVSGLHRALEDCYLTACCLKQVFQRERFFKYVSVCDKAFFERLVFKSYYINSPNTDRFHLKDVEICCPVCSHPLKLLNHYSFSNNTFHNVGMCSRCRRKFWVDVRAKQTYDEVVVSKRVVDMNEKKANRL